MDLSGKVALVTGAATGLGRAIAEQLLMKGARVSICDLDSDAGELTSEELSKRFGTAKVLFCHCDVTEGTEFEEAFETTLSEFDNIDIVINNAEIMNDKFWELEVDVNLNGVIRGTLLAQKFMDKKSKTGRGGIVVNIGSSASIRPQISTPIYTATKHAILGLTKSCGDEYHVKLNGVRVIAVCPGLIESEGMNKSNRFKSVDHEKAYQMVDIKGMIPQKLEHVAGHIVGLLSNAKSGSIWVVANGKAPTEMGYSTVNI